MVTTDKMHEVTVTLSPAAYEVIQKAAQSKKSVEAQASEMLESLAKPAKRKFSEELEYLMFQLRQYDTKRLWRIARSMMPKKQASRIRALHQKRDTSDLTEAETIELAGLMREYDRVFVSKNYAIGLLGDRGEDISEFAPEK